VPECLDVNVRITGENANQTNLSYEISPLMGNYHRQSRWVFLALWTESKKIHVDAVHHIRFRELQEEIWYTTIVKDPLVQVCAVEL
jgi:hypothetical protein